MILVTRHDLWCPGMTPNDPGVCEVAYKCSEAKFATVVKL